MMPKLFLSAILCWTQISPLIAQVVEGPGAGRAASTRISGAGSIGTGLTTPTPAAAPLTLSLSPLQTPSILTATPAPAEAPAAMAEPAISAALPVEKPQTIQALAPEKTTPRLETHRKEFEALGEKTPQTEPSLVPAAPSKAKSFLKPASRRLVTAALTAVLGLGALISAPLTPQFQASLPQQNAIVWQMPQAALSQVGQQQEAVYIQTASVEDVVKNFNPQVKLYVVGDVGLDKDALRSLSRSLAGKHWTVVLVEKAQGHSFQDIDGVTQYGQKAVEYRLGQQLGRLGAFQQQVNPLSQEADGTIFAMSMDTHGLFYYPSKTQSDAGLGKDQFKGNLDRWAIAVMQDKGDIAGAVKETVKNIDAQLQSALSQSQQAAQSKLAEASSALSTLEKTSALFAKNHPSAAIGRENIPALQSRLKEAQTAYAAGKSAEALQSASSVLSTAQQAVGLMNGFEAEAASAQSSIKEAGAEIDSLAAAASRLLASHSGLTGDIARPDVKAFQEKLKTAASLIEKEPAHAAAMASSVRADVKALSQAVLEYPAGEAALDAAQGALKTQQGRLRSSDASAPLKQAQTALSDARASYEKGDSAYVSQLSQAKASISAADAAITSADRAAAAKNMAFWIIISLLTLGLGALGFFLRRKVLGARSTAEKLYGDWNAALAAKGDDLFGPLEQRVNVYLGSAAEPRPFTGLSRKVEAQTREAAGTLALLWDSANDVLTQAKSLLKPSLKNYFLSGDIEKARRLLSDLPIPVKPGDAVAKLYGKERDWRDSLTVKETDTFTFDVLIKDFNKNWELAVKNLDAFEAADNSFGPLTEKTAALIQTSSAKASELAKLGASDGLFLAPSLLSKLIPAAAAALKKLEAGFEKDPLGSMQGSGADAQRMAQEAAALEDAVLGLRKNVAPGIAAAAASLKAADVATGWIDKALAKLSGRAEALAAKASEESIAPMTAEWSADAGALAQKVSRAAALGEAMQKAQSGAIDATSAQVAAAREALGAQIGVSPSKMLAEKGSNPTGRLEAAQEQADAAKKSLGAGDNDAAEKALAEVSRWTAEAAAIVAASQAAVAAQDKTVAERGSETSRIESLVPEHQAVLQKIMKKFAASTLSLKAGDPAHPSANGTVSDNIDEAKESLEAAKQKLGKAVAAFAAGAVLAAAELLRQVLAQQQFALHRLSEITDKQARLDKTLASNQQLIGQLETRAAGYDNEVAGDKRAMKPTLAAFDKAKQALSAAKDAANAAKGDPFQAEAALLAAAAAFDQMYVSARNDRDMHAEADRSLKAAAGQLAGAQALAGESVNDGIADSPAILQARHELRALARQLSAAKDKFAIPHGDWNAVDSAADAVFSAAAKTAAVLKNELAEAENAVAAISNASSKVREAGNWSGGEGVYIPGTPGSPDLRDARSALEHGRYAEAIRQAQRAQSLAAAAIAAALAEVARIRRQREEEEARERRRRQAEEEERQRRNSSSGSSWGSSGSGGGSSSWGGSGSGGGSSSW